MAMSKEAIDRNMKLLGIPRLPPGHPEYSIGPQTHFSSRTSSQSEPKDLDLTTPDGSKSTTQPVKNKKA